MKMKIRSTAVSVLMLVLSLTACQKDAVVPEVAVNNETIAGVYKVTALSLQPTTGASHDVFSTLEDCQKLNTQTLNADNSYTLVDACDASNNETARWSLDTGNKITINGVTGDLVSFDGRNLVISFDNFIGMQGKIVETLTQQ